MLRDLVDWYRTHAPVTADSILPARDAAALEWAQRRTGEWGWPEEVRSLYFCCDGSERTPNGYLFPGYRMLTLDEVASTWGFQLHLNVHMAYASALGPERWTEDEHIDLYLRPPGDEFSSDEERDDFYARLSTTPPPRRYWRQPDPHLQPAGEQAGRFIAPFLPIAEDQSGGYLLVDRRSGELSGCITEYDKVDADYGRCAVWPGLRQMLVSTLDALDRGEPTATVRYPPTVVDGRISWDW